jgi:hypothetical protein
MSRPRGSSVIAPFLRKLAENPNEYGEGKLAVEMAELLLQRLKDGVPVADILKALERTDGAVKAQIEHSAAPPIPALRIENATPEELTELRRLAGGTDGGGTAVG